MNVRLEIFIEPECVNCDRAIQLASIVQRKLPQVQVDLIDITRPGVHPPQAVFAVPTYLINGKTHSLGNPDEQRLLGALASMVDSTH